MNHMRCVHSAERPSLVNRNRKVPTAKQRRFVQEYLVDLNATQAAIRAGYSAETAESTASRLMSNSKVASAVRLAQDERTTRTRITADRVVEELAKHAFGTIEDFFNPDTGHLLSVHEMSRTARSRIASVNVVRERTRTGTSDGKTVTTTEQTIELKLWDKMRALELLGRHLGMFKDNVDPQH